MRPLLGAALMVFLGVLLGACGGSGGSGGFSLTVTKSGSGGGTVTSSPAGINCGTACVQAYPSGTSLTLTATPDLGSIFVGWTGGSCSGTGTCPLVITGAMTETAIFEQPKTGPYAVKQTETLGGETLSGFVCDITTPFSVPAATTQVSWTFNFSPTSANGGAVTYAYSIPSAGESHDASGTYTITQPAADGSRVLAMSVSDHVVFNGFDGTIPLHYQFGLVPSNAPCP